MRTGLAIAASLSSIKPLSLNSVDTVQTEYTKLFGQLPELTRPTTKGEPVKHGITHKIVTKVTRFLLDQDVWLPISWLLLNANSTI